MHRTPPYSATALDRAIRERLLGELTELRGTTAWLLENAEQQQLAKPEESCRDIGPATSYGLISAGRTSDPKLPECIPQFGAAERDRRLRMTTYSELRRWGLTGARHLASE